jgi:hypothetical protein
MATQIFQRTLVHCPSAQSARRLANAFSDHGNQAGDTSKLLLFLNLNVPGVSAPLRVKRAVIVTLQRHPLEGDMDPRYLVQWAPAEPGPFPLFAGELRLEGDEDYDTFNLVLEGSYDPPLGLVGAGFDVIVGGHIAGICARNFLSTVADRIERAFAIDEARKVTEEERSRAKDAKMPRYG